MPTLNKILAIQFYYPAIYKTGMSDRDIWLERRLCLLRQNLRRCRYNIAADSLDESDLVLVYPRTLGRSASAARCALTELSHASQGFPASSPNTFAGSAGDKQ